MRVTYRWATNSRLRKHRQSDKDIQNSKTESRDHEEIGCDQILHMIVEKGAPCLRRRFALLNHVFGHRCLRYLDAELEKLAMDPRCSPHSIGRTHLPNQLANFLTDLWPARSTVPTFPGPIETEALTVPGDYGFRLDDDEGRAPLRPEARVCANITYIC